MDGRASSPWHASAGGIRTGVCDEDAGMLLTPGVFLYVKGKNRIGANLDVYRSGSGETEFSFKLQTYLYY